MSQRGAFPFLSETSRRCKVSWYVRQHFPDTIRRVFCMDTIFSGCALPFLLPLILSPLLESCVPFLVFLFIAAVNKIYFSF